MELKEKKLFLLDMDGTLYLGNDLFPYTKPFLKQIRENGGKYLFLTNNSSKGVADYIKKMNSLGIETEYEDFLTSAQVTASYLKRHHSDELIYVLGTKSLKEEFISAGLNVTDHIKDEITCLVMGFDTELTFKKLEDASKLLRGDIMYIATNPDLVCPTEYGYVPDCGSVSEMLYNATGKRPKIIGKPEAEMAETAVAMAGVTKAEAVVVGDRIYTDIACGINSGIDTVLVLSGETTKEILDKSEGKPTYVMRDVEELYNIIAKPL